MNKREEIHFSISADDAFVDNLSGMMMNRAAARQAAHQKCDDVPCLIQGVVLFCVGIFCCFSAETGRRSSRI
ncbi:MAG: hypothetical protein ACLVJ6_14370 [Merdibacter sp.]